jgi:oxygen-dependent protoporphyrinogen oxidase
MQGCELEAGPDSWLASKPVVTEVAAQLGIGSDIIGSNDSARRVYIVRQGKLHELPKRMVMMVPGDLNAAMKSSLFSRSTKLRFVTEIFSPQRTRTEDVSVHELVGSHFGEEMLEYVTEPLLSGVYGGESGKLSAQSVLPRFVAYERDYGSLIRAVRRKELHGRRSGSLFLTFRHGMQTLTDSMVAQIAASASFIHEEVLSLEQVPDGWRIRTAHGHWNAGHIVLAVPAHVAAQLLSASTPALASELSGIPYSSAILVTLVYRKLNASTPEGFGFLVPRRERQTVAATTFVAVKWPVRIPPHYVALRAFIVDPEAPQLLTLPDPQILELVSADFKRLLGITADPIFSKIERWPNSMPQYVVGHAARRKRIDNATSQLSGMHLVGNAYDGVGVPDCIRLAKQTADKVASELK